jgi:hypothetical protein
MEVRMRTTLVLDDNLVKRARHVAVDRGMTLSELVNHALRETLARGDGEAEPRFAMVTFGGPEPTAHSPADFDAVLAAEEDAPYQRRG